MGVCAPVPAQMYLSLYFYFLFFLSICVFCRPFLDQSISWHWGAASDSPGAHLMGQHILVLQSSGQRWIHEYAELAGLCFSCTQQSEKLEVRKYLLKRIFSSQTLFFVGGQI